MTYQEQLIKKYKKEGFKVLKIIRLNENGYPDLMLLKDGKTIYIESKEEKDTLKPLQKSRIKELRSLGFEAYCMQKNKGIIF